MKKIIMALDNKKILKKIKEINNLKIYIKNVQYREAILEILKREKNIDLIFINEKLSGEISIEDLINKIKIINRKVDIVFFLEKENIKKENKLKKLGINNIYISNKIKKNKISNLLEGKKEEKANKNIKEIFNKNNKFNKKENKIKNRKKIITIYGESELEKNKIINLLIMYLIKKNKKILLINLNKKIKKNYLILLNKKYLKNNKKTNIIKKEKIEINKNLVILNNFENKFKSLNEKNIEKNLNSKITSLKNNYDYIIFDFGYISNPFLKNKIIEETNIEVIIVNEKLLGIQEIKKIMEKQKENRKNNNKRLHIIQNKYYFNSISDLILKNIFNNFCKVHKISYNKIYKDLIQKLKKEEKIKILIKKYKK